MIIAVISLEVADRRANEVIGLLKSLIGPIISREGCIDCWLSAGIAPLWEQLPEAPGTETTVQIPAEFADRIFSGDATGIYHYDGSLTTPPCSEGVKWYVRKTPTQLSEDQIAAFTAIYDNNNRPVQALNNRTLYLDESPTLTIH